MTNAIDAAINAANTAAQDAAPQGQAVATVPQAAVPGQPMGLDSFSPGTMSCDAYVKVKEDGLKIGDSKFIESFEVIIDPQEIAVTRAIKFGNPVTYKKTYDNVTSTDGEPWQQVLQQVYRADPKAKPYPSADIPMTLAHDVTDGKETFEEGMTVGHSLSTTNAGEFDKFRRKLVANGLQSTPVRVKIGYQPKSGKGFSWGVVTFDLIGPADAASEAAE